jgi:hypothetical protein
MTVTVLMVRYQVREDAVDEVDAAIGRLVDALRDARPAGTRYALGRMADGVTYVGLLELEEGVDNPLPGLSEARDLQQVLAAAVVDGPPAPQPFTVVGAYGLLDGES